MPSFARADGTADTDSCDTEESRGVHLRDSVQQRPGSNEEGREHSSKVKATRWKTRKEGVDKASCLV